MYIASACQARGRITAQCDVDPADLTTGEHEVCSTLLDVSGTKLCDVWVTFAVTIAEQNGTADQSTLAKPKRK